jgi:hypothetical protein
MSQELVVQRLMHSLLVHLLNKEPTVWQMAAKIEKKRKTQQLAKELIARVHTQTHYTELIA